MKKSIFVAIALMSLSSFAKDSTIKGVNINLDDMQLNSEMELSKVSLDGKCILTVKEKEGHVSLVLSGESSKPGFKYDWRGSFDFRNEGKNLVIVDNDGLSTSVSRNKGTTKIIRKSGNIASGIEKRIIVLDKNNNIESLQISSEGLVAGRLLIPEGYEKNGKICKF